MLWVKNGVYISCTYTMPLVSDGEIFDVIRNLCHSARILLEESAIGLAGKETAIGDAIGLAVKRLRENPEQNRGLILLTDGANTAGAVEPLKAADLAASEGLKIYTIGVGADEMMVRSLFGNRRINPSADLDEKTLTAIAQKTGKPLLIVFR